MNYSREQEHRLMEPQQHTNDFDRLNPQERESVKRFLFGFFFGMIVCIYLGISNPRISIAVFDNQELIKHGAAEYRWVEYPDHILRWELCWKDTGKPVETTGIKPHGKE